VVVVAAAAVVIGYQFKLVGDQRTFIDVNSGDLASRRTLLGITLTETITPTDFSNLARKLGLAGASPDWREVLQFSWLSGTNTSFPMHGADTACHGAVWKLMNEKTDDDKRKLLASYMDLLRAGNVTGMSQLSAKVGKEQELRQAGNNE
jgi:hypothetical protein